MQIGSGKIKPFQSFNDLIITASAIKKTTKHFSSYFYKPYNLTRGQAMDSFARPTIFQRCEILPKRIKFHVASQQIAVAPKI